MKEIKGMIVACSGGLYKIACGKGRERTFLECRARGAFRNKGITPLVGDFCTVSDDGAGAVMIKSIDGRKNSLIRPALANLDTLFIVVPTKDPEPDLFAVDKLSAICEHNGIECVVAVSKCDLDPDAALRIKNIYEKTPYRVFLTSSVTKEGRAELCEYIAEHCADKTIAFSGASGIGKSSLLNSLFPELSLEVGGLSEKIKRGKNTTRTVELFFPETEAYGGVEIRIADTPGFTMLDFKNFDFFELPDLFGSFAEFGEYENSCRYTKCTHRKEQGCAVLDAVKRGKISPERHGSYVALYDILKDKHPWSR